MLGTLVRNDAFALEVSICLLSICLQCKGGWDKNQPVRVKERSSKSHLFPHPSGEETSSFCEFNVYMILSVKPVHPQLCTFPAAHRALPFRRLFPLCRWRNIKMMRTDGGGVNACPTMKPLLKGSFRRVGSMNFMLHCAIKTHQVPQPSDFTFLGSIAMTSTV